MPIAILRKTALQAIELLRNGRLSAQSIPRATPVPRVDSGSCNAGRIAQDVARFLWGSTRMPPLESYILTLATVVAGRETGFPSEALREMARIRVAHFKS